MKRPYELNIDEKTLGHCGYSFGEFIVLLLHSLNESPLVSQRALQAKGDLCIDVNNRYEITIDGIKHLEELLELATTKTPKKRTNYESYISLAISLINVYKSEYGLKGNKPGSYEPWAASDKVIATRLSELSSKYGIEIDPKKAIEATRKYLKSYNGNYGYTQTLKYFIYKNDTKRGSAEFGSRLCDIIDSLEDGEPVNNDWTNELI